MKAVLFNQHGGLEVLKYTNFPIPQPKTGEALIRLHAAALNRMDVFVRNECVVLLQKQWCDALSFAHCAEDGG